jgi:hypothetical protein
MVSFGAQTQLVRRRHHARKRPGRFGQFYGEAVAVCLLTSPASIHTCFIHRLLPPIKAKGFLIHITEVCKWINVLSQLNPVLIMFLQNQFLCCTP